MNLEYYKVAGHIFSVYYEDNNPSVNLTSFEPFRQSSSKSDLFRLTIYKRKYIPTDFVEVFSQVEESYVISCGTLSEGKRCFHLQANQIDLCWLIVSSDYREGTLYLYGYSRRWAFETSTMILYTLATSNMQTALFHASVVSKNGYAYLFLGKSGTGKSTHSQLWLNHLEGTELVNDDNPIVRIVDGEARVYGSPWSGKTPCYRNVNYPIGGIVSLSQAPYNHIKRMTPLSAYASLLSSIIGIRWDRNLADGLHETERTIVGLVPMWYMECLPNAEAALLCAKEIEVK